LAVLAKSARVVAVPSSLMIEGSVRLDSPGQLLDGTAITVSGQLDLNGQTLLVGSLTLADGTVTTGSGLLTLGGDITSQAAATTAVISGRLDLGGHTRTVSVADGTAEPDLLISAVISGSHGEGLIKTGDGTLVLTGINTYTGTTEVRAGTLVLNGSLANSAVTVDSTGTLAGSGATGSLTVGPGGMVGQGGGTGPSNGGGGTMPSSMSSFQVNINGLTAGSSYSQVQVVTGTLDLTNSVLNLSLSFQPAVGDQFTIIHVAGSGTVQGMFQGLPEGAVVHTAQGFFQISYQGGAGHDVVLTRVTIFQAFVAQVYLDLFQRPVDAFGLNYWSTLLSQGTSRADVVRQMEASQEYQALEIQDLYQKLLGRSAELDGLALWENFLAEGGAIEQVLASILGSGEYFAHHGGTNDTFLSAVYADVVGRSIDSFGAGVWGQELARGASRTDVAAAILASPEASAEVVQSLYNEFLHRAADSTGLATFTTALQQGPARTAITALLIGSEEYFSLNAPFLSQAYQDLVQQPIDAAGLARLSAMLSGPSTRQDVALLITADPAYQTSLVLRLYDSYLGQPPDAATLQSLVGLLQFGGTVEQVQAAILASPDYLQKRGGGTDDGFLDALFGDLLIRAVDPTGRATFDQALAAGVSRSQVVQAVLTSGEYHQLLVQSYFQQYLHRQADPFGLNTFVDALHQNVRDEVIIAAIVGSQEYFARL
jgi:autotransporter-associated beta strand protein